MSRHPQNRREFLGQVAAGIAGAGVSLNAPEILCAAAGEMPTRTLGRTGEKVSLIGLGGFHLGHIPEEKDALRLVHEAIDHGVTFMDNCWDYNDGKSEVWMGNALADGHRKKVFLMTKLDGQTKESANRQLEESLRRLKTDTIDLMQLHEIIRPSDPDRIFGPNGSIEAVVAAKKAGKIRYIGFTGHKDPDIFLKMLDTGAKHNFTFDSVQMPINLLDYHFKSFEKKVLPVLVKRNIGVLAMKTLAEGHLLKTKTVTPTEALHYAMNLPVSVVITGCETSERLQQAVEAARSFRKLTPKEVASLRAKTESVARNGEFEPFKTSSMYDGTVNNPQWLG